MTNNDKRDIVRKIMRSPGMGKWDGPWSHGTRITARFEVRKSLLVFKLLKNLFPEFNITRNKLSSQSREYHKSLRRITIYIPTGC